MVSRKSGTKKTVKSTGKQNTLDMITAKKPTAKKPTVKKTVAKKPIAKNTVVKKPTAIKKPTAKKSKYYLYYGMYDEDESERLIHCIVNYAEKPFATADSIKKARLIAIDTLKIYDKKGQIIGISKNPREQIWLERDTECIVTMFINDPYEWPLGSGVFFQKPSIALKQGYRFSA